MTRASRPSSLRRLSLWAVVSAVCCVSAAAVGEPAATPAVTDDAADAAPLVPPLAPPMNEPLVPPADTPPPEAAPSEDEPMEPAGPNAPLVQPVVSPLGGRILRCNHEQCTQRAIRRSPLVRAASLSFDSYAAKFREARAARWPKITMTGFFSILPTLKENRDGSAPWSDYDFSLNKLGPLAVTEVSVTQPLYTFGKLDILRRLASQGVEIGKATRRIAEDEMRYQVARAYWGLVLIAAMDDMIRDGKKMMVEQREKLEKQRDEGDEKFNQSDLAKLQMYTADFEDKIRVTERSRAQAMDGLRMAMDDGTDVVIVPRDTDLKPILFNILPTEAYETTALANHPRLIAMRHGVSARLQQVELAKANLLPDFAAVARLAGTYAPTRDTDTSSIASNPNNIAQSGAGIAVSWSLDIFRNIVKLKQARIDLATQTAQERGEREKLRMEVRQLYRELVDARAMLPIHEQAMKAARGTLNAENEMYENGFQEFAPVLSALEAYYRRRIAWLDAMYNHNLAVAALSRAVGMDVTHVETVHVPAPATDAPPAK